MPRDRRLPYVNPESFSAREIGGTNNDWSPKARVRTITASQNSRRHDGWIRVNATSGAVTITLESAVPCRGRFHHFKKIDSSSNAMIIATSDGQTIDGQSTITTTRQYAHYCAVSNGTNWELWQAGVGATGGEGAGHQEIFARVRADDEIIWQTGEITTCLKSSVGHYDYTLSVSFPSVVIDSETFYKYKVNVTPSAKAGNGGDGISPFLGFSSDDAVLTDQNAGYSNFWYSEITSKIYLLGPDADDVWIHNPADFNNPVQEDALDDVRTTSGEAGVLSREGTILWLSGDATTSVRAYNVSTDTWYSFGTTDDMVCVAGTDSYVIIHNNTNGKLERYDPTFGTPTLNAATRQWTVTAFSGNSAFGVWDGDNHLWFAVNANLIQIDPGADPINTHAYPAAWGVGFTPVYDSLRNRLFCGFQSSQTDIWSYSGWNNAVNNSGDWDLYIRTVEAQAMYHDPVSDILLITEPGLSVVHRFYCATGQKIDTVSMDDTDPANPQVDYDMRAGSPATIFYKDGSAYLMGATSAGAEYLVRINYDGDPIPGFGGASGAVSSVLTADYEITGANTFTVHLYRSTNPPIYNDGEHSVDVAGDLA